MHLGALALAALAPGVPTPPQGVCAHHQGGGLREAACSGPCGHLCAVWLLGLAMGGAGGDCRADPGNPQCPGLGLVEGLAGGRFTDHPPGPSLRGQWGRVPAPQLLLNECHTPSTQFWGVAKG